MPHLVERGHICITYAMSHTHLCPTSVTVSDYYFLFNASYISSALMAGLPLCQPQPEVSLWLKHQTSNIMNNII